MEDPGWRHRLAWRRFSVFVNWALGERVAGSGSWPEPLGLQARVAPAQDERAELSRSQQGLCAVSQAGCQRHRPSFPHCLGVPVSLAPWHAGPQGALCRARGVGRGSPFPEDEQTPGTRHSYRQRLNSNLSGGPEPKPEVPLGSRNGCYAAIGDLCRWGRWARTHPCSSGIPSTPESRGGRATAGGGCHRAVCWGSRLEAWRPQRPGP